MSNLQLAIMASFLGLFFGSFYNVVGIRFLKRESFSFPPSHCCSCNHKLGARDLVPVFSFLSTKGKCRYCKDTISKIYPLGEILTSISYFIVVYKFGLTLEALIQLIFITTMIISTVTDLIDMIVPNKFILVGLVLTLILRIIIRDELSYYLASALIAFVFTLFISMLSKWQLGGADIKLYSLIGLNVGLSGAVGSLFYASLFCVAYFIPKMIKGEQVRGVEIPFVPFILLGILTIYIYNAYLFIDNIVMFII